MSARTVSQWFARCQRAALLAVVALGCGDNRGRPPDAAPTAPALRNPVALPDGELARAAIDALVPGCGACHGLTRRQLVNWRTLTDAALATCLTDPAVESPASARAMLDCARAMPGGDAAAKQLGIYAAATHLAWFAFVEQRAGTTGAVAAAAMPRPGGRAAPWTQDQLDVVAEWFARGLPRLDEAVPEETPPASCAPAIGPEVAAHVAAMQTAGWRAVNASSGLAMFGCGAATDPRACLTAIPLAADQPYGAGWDVAGRGGWRVLADVGYHTQYWTRSSPDGRFVAHGVADVPGSYVIDLQRGAQVPIAALYDPAWFPDGSGFVFQGAARNTCAASVLTANPAQVTMTEPGCTQLDAIGLYEHTGRMLGGDHIAIASQFVTDDGGHAPTLGDPDASFGARASLAAVPLVFDGARFTAKPAVTVATAFEGDAALSPSTRLVMSRLAGPGERPLGFVLREVIATPAGASYAIRAPERARYCVTGGKVAFSYDERWVVFHRYVTAGDAVELGFAGPADPAFAPYLTVGASNLYLMDLTTGAPVRITTMRPGQYALYPHFRSDGWIYAAVRDAGREYMVASDAALIAEQP